DQVSDLSRLGGRAILRARVVWNRGPVREVDAVPAAGVSGRRAADRGGASRDEPGGVAALLLEQRIAGEDRRLQPRRTTHVHAVQRTNRTRVPAPRKPRANRTARRTGQPRSNRVRGTSSHLPLFLR